jgi:hypothetical protein
MAVYVRIMTSDTGSLVVAICDKELLGKVFREGDITLDVSRAFFEGDLMDADEAVEYLHDAFTAIVVGEEAVNKAIEAGMVHPEAVLRVEGVPYAQIVRI